MADTQKTWAEIQTLLADNTAGAISPQDMRDAIYSLVPSFGGVYVAGNSTATSIVSANTDYVTNWNSSGAQTNARQFTVSTAGRLTYSGTVNIHCHVACTISFSVSVAASKEVQFKIYKNGSTEVAGSLTTVDTNGATVTLSTAIHCDVGLSTNDYLEVWVSNETDTTNVTLEDCYLFASSMIVTS